jgi:hypothetical protein
MIFAENWLRDIAINFMRMSSFFSQPTSQMRIRIFSDFCTSLHGKNVYEEIFETRLMKEYGEGPDKRICITTGNDYTHAILWNKAMPVLLTNVPRKNVIGLAYEPPHFLGIDETFVKFAKNHIGKYFIGDVGNLPAPFVGGKAYLSHTAPLQMIPVKKHNLMSIMISQKMNAPGHIYRHQLVQEILKTNLPIDIYGRGCSFYSLLDPRIKGVFEEKEPYADYQFHICVENFQTSYYYSEKIINPLLCNSTPIYWGCKNIDDSFPNCVYLLSGNLDEDMIFLKHVAKDPLRYMKQIDIDAVKQETNLLKNLDKLYD